MPIRLLLVDDHQIIRHGIRALLKEHEEIEIVGEVENGKQALEAMRTTRPNVVLMDINMPVLSGIETTKLIHHKYPDVKVLALTMHSEPNYIVSILKAGAIGYILKNSDGKVLRDAILAASRGESYFPNEVSDAVLHSIMKNKPASHNTPTSLTSREVEVLKLISYGLTTAKIAEKLFISKRTVDTHRNNLLSKLNLSNTAGLVRYAIENNLA